MRTILYNGKVITPETIFRGGVVVEDNKIISVFKDDNFIKEGMAIDCEGNYISPGFVDIHCHGTYNASFSSGSTDELNRAVAYHAKYGTTSVLPTTLSASHNQILSALKCIKKAMEMSPQGARILGAHLEGNYMNPKCAGAQNPEYLYGADPSEYMELIDTGIVRRVSAAMVRASCMMTLPRKESSWAEAGVVADRNPMMSNRSTAVLITCNIPDLHEALTTRRPNCRLPLSGCQGTGRYTRPYLHSSRANW